MKQLAHSSWLFILLSLPIATVGWFLKLGGQAGADAYIIIGTGLVVVFCALALQQLVRRLDLPILAPLGLFGMGLALLTFETLAQPLSRAASLTLRMLGELLAASGRLAPDKAKPGVGPKSGRIAAAAAAHQPALLAW